MKESMQSLRCTAERFCRAYDLTFTANFVRENDPSEMNCILQRADMLRNKTFLFDDPWDMEPCPVPYQIGLEDWVHSPNGDPEWVFMLNRHDFVPKLVQAWAFTGDKAYLQQVKDFLLDWVEKNPITKEGTPATRTIDTGVRCMNWCTLILHLAAQEMLTEDETQRLLTSLREQLENLRERYITKYTLSNWGVLQTTAICAAGLWFGDAIPEDLVQWAWEEFASQMELQILGDGVHWERSPMYHVVVLNACMNLLAQIRLAEEAGQPLSEAVRFAAWEDLSWTDVKEANAAPGEGFAGHQRGWLTVAVRVMSRQVLYSADPVFNQLTQCDSDETDVRGVLSCAASLLTGSGMYRDAAGDKPYTTAVWLTGRPGIQHFAQVNPVKPGHTTWHCGESGNVYFRSAWAPDASFAWLTDSTLGSSHGHVDQTHLSLFYKGQPFLIDSGRYTYREDDPLRVELKNPTAHNVAVLDGQSGGEANGSWSYAGYDPVMPTCCVDLGELRYAEAPLYGTLESGELYLIRRKLLNCGEQIWISVQDVSCQGIHEVQEFLHLDSAVTVTEEANRVLLQRKDAALALYTAEPFVQKVGVVSQHYNEKDEAPVLVKTVAMQDHLASALLITAADITVNPVPVYQSGNPEPLPEQKAQAWQFTLSDGTEWTFIFFHEETWRGNKVFTCQGVPIYGKAIALRKAGETWQRIRVKA